MFDRGTHIEVIVGRAALRRPDFIELIAGMLEKVGQKPLLVVCDGPAESIDLLQAYDNGLRLASIVRSRIAIVLSGRDPTDSDRMTDLAATNRGTCVRTFRDLPAAKAWLAVD